MLTNLTQNLELSQLDFRQQSQHPGKTTEHSRPLQHRNPRARGPCLRRVLRGRQRAAAAASRRTRQTPSPCSSTRLPGQAQRRCRHLFLNSPSRRLRALNKILPTPPGVSITGHQQKPVLLQHRVLSWWAEDQVASLPRGTGTVPSCP